MKPSIPENRSCSLPASLSTRMKTCALGLAICLAAFSASAQQSQPGEVAATVTQQGGDAASAPAPQAPDSSNQTVSPVLTIPAGTVIAVRVEQWLSSDRNVPGDAFNASLDQPVIVNGWIVARRGQLVMGRVSEAQKAGRTTGTSKLGVQLSELTLVDGQQLPVQTTLLQSSAGNSHGQDAATIGTTTAVGAAIGAAANGGEGAGVGAVIGAAAGIVGVLATRGKSTVIPPETLLTFRLQAPVSISTQRSQFAFQPVTQQDQDAYADQDRPHMNGPARPGYPPPYPPPPSYYVYPYAYGYPYAYPYGYYPVPFSIGFYGGYGFGSRFGGFRGGHRHW
jgi:hypothetical protein